MSILKRLLVRKRVEDYNPKDDPSIVERERISARTDSIAKIAEDFHRRVERGRFPILIDEPVERRLW